ncbi:type II secretion system F family protein [Bacillus solimangrovi]|uniref:Type II secretion system protein F n=1 Tax=Bacillus solimangrovi TaxID=1305675 RepID=A0A1E5LBJ2_9BACI|nr:type II secretion system F family protein [Bacillus solimangrovi]OEH91453.1 type II secretion system protein F [Bacillus solimangrovi]
MAHFTYEGRQKTGKRVNGKISSSSKHAAMLTLRDKGIKISKIEELPQTIWNKDLTIGNPVKLQDFVIFLRQFSTLLQAGVSVVETVHVLGGQTSSKALASALHVVEEDLRGGISLSEASSKHKKVFPSIYVNMVRAGEIGGNLDETLERLAVHFEKQNHTMQKIKSALAYPIVVGILAIGVIIFLLTSVVPTFAEMFADFGGELPAITQFVLGASEWMQRFWWLILLLVVLLVVSIMVIRKNKDSKYFLDYAILKTPIFGKILQKAMIARMTRTLSSLFSSSVPVLQAISIVEKVVENEVLVRVLKNARDSLESGESLTTPMQKHWVFPPLVTQMIAIGEKTGALDAMLAKVADFYETEVDNATESLKSLIEPLMIVLLAGIVGVIVLAIMVPMFEIFNQIN